MRTSEYTTPIKRNPYYSSTGIIKAADRNGRCYSVGEITYQLFDEENFQYVISPYWNIIDKLSPSIFDGIPGIDMSKRLSHYYRVNLTPTFIEMRTPGKGREDLRELLSRVNLDYYDRFEWLLRSESRCGDDNLFVIRKRKPKNYRLDRMTYDDVNYMQVDDRIDVDETKINSVDQALLTAALTNCKKVKMIHRNKEMSNSDLENILAFISIIANDKSNLPPKRHPGRPKKNYNKLEIVNIKNQLNNKTINENQAMEKLGIKSRSTLYRRLKEV